MTKIPTMPASVLARNFAEKTPAVHAIRLAAIPGANVIATTSSTISADSIRRATK